jgi:HPt (histidine-containing phosphotransfer) domain-containing protein
MEDRYMDVKNESKPSSDEALGSLESDVGSEVYRELLEAFLAHLSLQAVELGIAAADGDVVAAQYVAHQIKGTATSFGATRLDEVAHHILVMEAGQRELLRSLVSKLDAEIRSLQAGAGVSAGNQ